MYNFQKSQERYLHDPTFYNMVDSITNALLRKDISIELIFDAVQLAIIKYTEELVREMHRVNGFPMP